MGSFFLRPSSTVSELYGQGIAIVQRLNIKKSRIHMFEHVDKYIFNFLYFFNKCHYFHKKFKMIACFYEKQTALV